jgi:hypothetical protein
MTHQLRYPVVIGALDLGVAGLLLLIAPVLGVLMGGIGLLVVGTWLGQHVGPSQTPAVSRSAGDVERLDAQSG